MVQPEAAWTIRLDDAGVRSGLATKEGAFTDIYILFIDARTGERSVAKATIPGERRHLFERRVPARGFAAPMDADEAQALADEAVAATDGKIMRRYWIVLGEDEPIMHRSGETRPADEITPGDSVLLEPHRTVLYVWDAWPDEEAGTIEFSLGEEYEGRRFEVERKLLELERRSQAS